MEEKKVLQEELPEEQARQEEEEKLSQEEQEFGEFEAHIQDLEAQAERLRESFPEFDLQKELCNPVFLQLTAPGTGISVEDAYFALHRKELQEAAARQTREKVVSAIQSGSRRPLEAGTTGQAQSMTTFHYGNASREQREAFKKELRRAWGRGEKVYPQAGR